ncbi:MAG: hypothetical protein WBX25_32700 [Rhodomicrobium sp.]
MSALLVFILNAIYIIGGVVLLLGFIIFFSMIFASMHIPAALIYMLIGSYIAYAIIFALPF